MRINERIKSLLNKYVNKRSMFYSGIFSLLIAVTFPNILVGALYCLGTYLIGNLIESSKAVEMLSRVYEFAKKTSEHAKAFFSKSYNFLRHGLPKSIKSFFKNISNRISFDFGLGKHFDKLKEKFDAIKDKNKITKENLNIAAKAFSSIEVTSNEMVERNVRINNVYVEMAKLNQQVNDNIDKIRAEMSSTREIQKDIDATWKSTAGTLGRIDAKIQESAEICEEIEASLSESNKKLSDLIKKYGLYKLNRETNRFINDENIVKRGAGGRPVSPGKAG